MARTSSPAPRFRGPGGRLVPPPHVRGPVLVPGPLFWAAVALGLPALGVASARAGGPGSWQSWFVGAGVLVGALVALGLLVEEVAARSLWPRPPRGARLVVVPQPQAPRWSPLESGGRPGRDWTVSSRRGVTSRSRLWVAGDELVVVSWLHRRSRFPLSGPDALQRLLVVTVEGVPASVELLGPGDLPRGSLFWPGWFPSADRAPVQALADAAGLELVEREASERPPTSQDRLDERGALDLLTAGNLALGRAAGILVSAVPAAAGPVAGTAGLPQAVVLAGATGVVAAVVGAVLGLVGGHRDQGFAGGRLPVRNNARPRGVAPGRRASRSRRTRRGER